MSFYQQVAATVVGLMLYDLFVTLIMWYRED